MNRFSILTNDMHRCIRCGSNKGIHIHEVYNGTADRDKSIKYGCCVPLCGIHHNLSNDGVHYDKRFANYLKEKMQLKFQEVYPDLDFVAIFNKNYIGGYDERSKVD